MGEKPQLTIAEVRTMFHPVTDENPQEYLIAQLVVRVDREADEVGKPLSVSFSVEPQEGRDG